MTPKIGKIVFAHSSAKIICNFLQSSLNTSVVAFLNHNILERLEKNSALNYYVEWSCLTVSIASKMYF